MLRKSHGEAVETAQSYKIAGAHLINIGAMSDQPDLRAAWKEANAGVREAEERLGAAWTAFAAGKGTPPDKSLLEEVSRLRRECDQRLLALLDEHGKRAKDTKERPGA